MQKAQSGYLTGWGDEEYLDALPGDEITVKYPVAGQYTGICFKDPALFNFYYILYFTTFVVN